MTRNRIVAAVLSLFLVGTGATAALAQAGTAPTDQVTDRATDRGTDIAKAIERIKARAQEAINNRLVRVDRLQEGIDNHKAHLSENHYGQLNSKLVTTEAGLEQLSRQIEDASTLEELRVLIPQIWQDYRVYVLLTPQVKLVIAGDTAVYAGEKAAEIITRLGEAITKAEERVGHPLPDARQMLDEIKTNLAAAVGAADPVAESVLPLTSADWNNGTAQPVLEAGKEGIRLAHGWFVEAREGAKELIAYLHSLGPDGAATDAAPGTDSS